jgi:DNA-binding response OmpR family regulator
MIKRVAVVDDSPQDLDTISKILKKKKYEVSTFENGVLAFDFLNKNECDLILMDILMDTFSGYDFVRLLKEKFKVKAKIAYISIIPKAEADLKWSDAFIQKPFSPCTLLASVENLIGK